MHILTSIGIIFIKVCHFYVKWFLCSIMLHAFYSPCCFAGALSRLDAVHTESCTRRKTAKCWGLSNYPAYYHFILSAAFWNKKNTFWWMFLNMILPGRDLGCVSGQYWPGISEWQERCQCRTKRNMASEVPEDGDGLTNVWHPKRRYKTHHTNTVRLKHILKWFKTLWLRDVFNTGFQVMWTETKPNACYRTTVSSLIWIWVLWRSARSRVTLRERAKFTSHQLCRNWRN